MKRDKITWVEDDGLREILCVRMIDGRVSKQVLNRATQGRFKVVPIAKSQLSRP